MSITRDKLYDLTTGKASSDVLYFTANPNGEAEVVTVHLRQSGSIKKLKWDLDFADVIIKGRASKGNIVTKYAVKRIELKEKGLSTLKPRKIWFDDVVQRLNVDGRGDLLGEFRAEDQLLVVNQRGFVKVIPPELNTHFDSDLIALEKWNPKKPISAVYFDGEKERYYIKRFLIESTNKEELIISESPKSQLEIMSTEWRPVFELEFSKPRGKEAKPNLEIDVENFISVKGIKALGNQLTSLKVKNINELKALEYEEPKEQQANEIEVVGEESIDSTNSEIESNDDDSDQPTLF